MAAKSKLNSKGRSQNKLKLNIQRRSRKKLKLNSQRRSHQQPAAFTATAAIAPQSKAVITQRAKVRVKICNVPVWIFEQDRTSLLMKAATIKAQRKEWKFSEWTEKIRAEVKANWGGCNWGGKRSQPAAPAASPVEECSESTANAQASKIHPLVSAPENSQRRSSEEQPLSSPEFRFIRKLGSGTYGRVFLCEHKGNTYAVKIPKDGIGSNSKELEILRKLKANGSASGDSHHANLLRLLFFLDKGDGRHWLFFEYFRMTLRDFLLQHEKEQIAMKKPLLLWLVEPLCSAVSCLHSQGILHRDIKPSNILLNYAGPTSNAMASDVLNQPSANSTNLTSASRLKWPASLLQRMEAHATDNSAHPIPILADFGTSTMSSMHDTPSKKTDELPDLPPHLTKKVTTLWYASPEQLMPADVYSYPADVWSIGTVFGEIAALRPLCAASDASSDENLEQLRQTYLLWLNLAAQSGASKNTDGACKTDFEKSVKRHLRKHFSPRQLFFREHFFALQGQTVDEDFITFLSNILEIDPALRCPSKLLTHIFSEHCRSLSTFTSCRQPAALTDGSLQQSAATPLQQRLDLVLGLDKIDLSALLYHMEEIPTGNYRRLDSVAFVETTVATATKIPLTPQPVINFLYQTMAIALEVIQGLMGKSHRFNADGIYASLSQPAADPTAGPNRIPASGGQICAIWGTEIGSRREQAMISWDYDVDLCVFITPGFNFSAIWESVKTWLEPLGVHCFEHSRDFKYRIAPQDPLAYNRWRELYHEARVNNLGVPRPKLMQIASEKKKQGCPPSKPSGPNCIDIEVYCVQPAATRATPAAGKMQPAAPITFKGSKLIQVAPEKIFPIVEGIFGPLRIPLMRTPVLLEAEYGKDWGTRRVIKIVSASLASRTIELKHDDSGCPLRAWPNITLRGCPSLFGGFYGAGLRESAKDVPWRFFVKEITHQEIAASGGLQ
jgi:serine/threonine protein kinase